MYLRILIASLLGLGLSVLSAFIAVLDIRLTPPSTSYVNGFPTMVRKSWGLEDRQSITNTVPPNGVAGRDMLVSQEVCAGWPIKWIRGTRTGVFDSNNGSIMWLASETLVPQPNVPSLSSIVPVPLIPKPLQLSLNILFWGAICLQLMIVARWLRRSRRRRRGACEHCGYDMLGVRQPVCPECGAKYRISSPPRLADAC